MTSLGQRNEVAVTNIRLDKIHASHRDVVDDLLEGAYDLIEGGWTELVLRRVQVVTVAHPADVANGAGTVWCRWGRIEGGLG